MNTEGLVCGDLSTFTQQGKERGQISGKDIRQATVLRLLAAFIFTDTDKSFYYRKDPATLVKTNTALLPPVPKVQGRKGLLQLSCRPSLVGKSMPSTVSFSSDCQWGSSVLRWGTSSNQQNMEWLAVWEGFWPPMLPDPTQTSSREECFLLHKMFLALIYRYGLLH